MCISAPSLLVSPCRISPCRSPVFRAYWASDKSPESSRWLPGPRPPPWTLCRTVDFSKPRSASGIRGSHNDKTIEHRLLRGFVANEVAHPVDEIYDSIEETRHVGIGMTATVVGFPSVVIKGSQKPALFAGCFTIENDALAEQPTNVAV